MAKKTIQLVVYVPIKLKTDRNKMHQKTMMMMADIK
jgi:hypothetical protein